MGYYLFSLSPLPIFICLPYSSPFFSIWCSYSFSSLPIFICSSLFSHLPKRCYSSSSSPLPWIVICPFHPLFPWIVIHHLHYYFSWIVVFFFHDLFSWIIIHFPYHFFSFTFPSSPLPINCYCRLCRLFPWTIVHFFCHFFSFALFVLLLISSYLLLFVIFMSFHMSYYSCFSLHRLICCFFFHLFLFVVAHPHCHLFLWATRPFFYLFLTIICFIFNSCSFFSSCMSFFSCCSSSS